MRRFLAIVRATAMEVLSEPLALLVTMSSMALAALTPALHYHQFGDPSRMARDAGLSALLVGGLSYAVFCTVRTFRREVESGTMQMALAHSVSRRMFFFAKLCGSYAAYLVFAATLASVSLTVVNGAEIGGELVRNGAEIRPIWGVSFALAVSAAVVPPVFAAVLNRFAGFRFTLTANVLMAALSVAGVAYRFDARLAARFLPVAAMLLLPAAVFAAASAAFAARWRANAALSASGLLFAAALPLMGNYCLPDVLYKGGSLPPWHFALALVATAPLVAGFAAMGAQTLERRDVEGGL